MHETLLHSRWLYSFDRMETFLNKFLGDERVGEGRQVTNRRVDELATDGRRPAGARQSPTRRSSCTRTRRRRCSAGWPTTVRRRKHPEGVVTYIIDRNVNYTNVCVARCKFCAFYRPVGSAEGYTLGFDEIFRKIDETIALGGGQLLLQGGHNPDMPLEWYEDLFRGVKTAVSRRSGCTRCRRPRSSTSRGCRSCPCPRSSSG